MSPAPATTPRELLEAHSPLQLTEFGRKIAAEVEADQWAASIAGTLTERAAAEPPYKIDAMAEDYVKDFLEADMRDRVGETAYNHGIERGAVRAVLRVVLRNRLLTDTGRNPSEKKPGPGQEIPTATTAAG